MISMLADQDAGSPLFPGPDVRRQNDDYLTAALGQALLRIPSGAVGPTLDMPGFQRSLQQFDFESPRPLADILPWVIEQLEHGIVQLRHPLYCGLFNPLPTFPSECAERIVAAFNPQLATATTSPVPVQIEAHVIRSIAGRAGMPSGSAGHFTSGGSEANFTALICALTKANAQYGSDGARAFAGQPTLYVSEDAHVAWFKIAHQAGIGRTAVRTVGTDAAGRMDLTGLRSSISADRAAGCVPVMIAATAGTTSAGMIDPLADCADIARLTGTWLHVDAAWGGAVIVSDRLRGLLAGIEDSDSITIDAHKWFATTMGCGMFITSRPAILSDAFHVTARSAHYMPSNACNVDPYVSSSQWSRRFMGLRLFLSLAAAGWNGYAEHVERAVELSDFLKTELTARGWTCANDSRMAVLCMVPPPSCNNAPVIAKAVVGSKQAWVATTRFQGQDVVRICITNGQSTPRDISFLAELLHATAHSAVT